MNSFSDPEQLALAWRRGADTAIENGEPPQIALGLDFFIRNSCLNLLALQSISRRNLGPQNPIVLAGGDGWLWLLATFMWRSPESSHRRGVGSPPDTTTEERSAGHEPGVDFAGRLVVFGGGDSALYVAARNIADQYGDADAAPAGLNWYAPGAVAAGAEGSDFELIPFSLHAGD